MTITAGWDLQWAKETSSSNAEFRGTPTPFHETCLSRLS